MIKYKVISQSFSIFSTYSRSTPIPVVHVHVGGPEDVEVGGGQVGHVRPLLLGLHADGVPLRAVPGGLDALLDESSVVQVDLREGCPSFARPVNPCVTIRDRIQMACLDLIV